LIGRCGAHRVDDASKEFAGDEPAKRVAHLGGDRHVRVLAAEHHNRIAGHGAVGARAQSPPHAKRIYNRDNRSTNPFAA
jgi:hypothetical protein